MKKTDLQDLTGRGRKVVRSKDAELKVAHRVGSQGLDVCSTEGRKSERVEEGSVCEIEEQVSRAV